MAVKHAFVSTIADGGSTGLVRPSNWNADHTGTNEHTHADTDNGGVLPDGTVTYAIIQNVSATDKVLGRMSTGAGDVEEIACTAAGRALLDDASAAAQKTTLSLDQVDNYSAQSLVLMSQVFS